MSTEENTFRYFFWHNWLTWGVILTIAFFTLRHMGGVVIGAIHKAFRFRKLYKTIAALPSTLPADRWLNISLESYLQHPKRFGSVITDRTFTARFGHVIAFIDGEAYVALFTRKTYLDLMAAWCTPATHWVPVMGRGTSIPAKPLYNWNVGFERYPIPEVVALGGWPVVGDRWRARCEAAGPVLETADLDEQFIVEREAALRDYRLGFWRFVF